MVIYVVEYIIKENYNALILYLLIFNVALSSNQNKSMFILISVDNISLIYSTDKYSFIIAFVIISCLSSQISLYM